MRTFFGMVLGCLLTILTVYVHDNVRTTAAEGSASSRTIVNWDVATGEWNRVTDNVRHAWDRLVNSDRSKT